MRREMCPVGYGGSDPSPPSINRRLGQVHHLGCGEGRGTPLVPFNVQLAMSGAEVAFLIATSHNACDSLPIMKRQPDQRLLNCLATYDPQIANLALALREIVLEEAPEKI